MNQHDVAALANKIAAEHLQAPPNFVYDHADCQVLPLEVQEEVFDEVGDILQDCAIKIIGGVR
jgi:hypothetical protein